MKKHLNPVLKYGGILAASLLYAAAIALFLDPNQLAPGGVSGIAIIVNHLLPIPTGTLILMMNVPLLLLGMWKLGFQFVLSTLVAVISSSFFTNLLAPYGPLTTDPLLAACAGGGLLAVGMGLLFKLGATSGGTDILIRVIKLKYKHLKTGSLFLITDCCVIAASALVFRNVDLALYAAIATILSSFCLDLVLYGRDEAKLVYLITDHEKAIANRLLEELEIGVTYLQGQGAYTRDNKKVILCAMQKRLLPRVQEIAMEEDPYAFLIVTSASEIFGEGFKDISAPRL
ncbi:MAG: YitT family protein [Clostridia bacterium]|nr:YitT family protein [Clostridia bacterium]